MKRAIIAVCLVVCVSYLFAGPPLNYSVGTNSAVIVAERNIQNAAAWATNTAYLQGQVVKVGNHSFYWAVTNGTSHTSGTGPSHGWGDGTDGTLTWRAMMTRPRKSVVVVNDSTNTVYISIGFPAEVNKGIRLNGSGGSVSLGDYQGRIYAIAGSDGNNVVISEW